MQNQPYVLDANQARKLFISTFESAHPRTTAHLQHELLLSIKELYNGMSMSVNTFKDFYLLEMDIDDVDDETFLKFLFLIEKYLKVLGYDAEYHESEERLDFMF